MTAERWEQVEALFAAALDRSPVEREAFLVAACPDDPELRAEVHALLGADDAASMYFEELQSEAVLPLAPREAVDLVGREIGPWRVVDLLGGGGMGHVYLAARADGCYEQEVALKLLRPEREASETYRRFRAERQILASLHHPGIARLLGGGVAVLEGGANLPYLAMEYVEGSPIDVYCAARGLGLRERVRLFLEVCAAVHYAHRNLVVHRDLKPSNVLVTTDGAEDKPQVKLLDFGIAKLLGPETAGATRTTHPLMTPAYASPELVSGAPITTASDVYQLGLLLYQLLTGRRPYSVHGLALSDFARVVLEQPPQRPSAVVIDAEGEEARSESAPALPMASGPLHRALRGDLDAIVLKALRKEPEARYASAEALGDDLERYLQGLPVEAHRGTTGYRLRKFARRHKTGVLISIVILAMLVGASVLYNVRVTAERDRAAATAATSQHVKDYLLGLFHEDGGRGEAAIRAREASLALLEPAARRLESDLRGEPEVRSELSHAFGELFWSVGRYDLAGVMLRSAVALRDSLPHVAPADLAASLHAYGHFLGALGGEPDSAARYLERAVGLWRTLPQESGSLARSLLLYSRYLPEGDRRRGAFYEEGLEILRRVYGPRSAEVGRALHAYHRKGGPASDTAAAIAGLRSAVNILEQTAGPSHETAEALEDLGFLLEAAARGEGDVPSEGLPLLRRAFEMNRAVTGLHGPHVLRMGTNYGMALHRRGRLTEADSLFRSLLSAADTPLIQESSGHGYALFGHGRNLLSLGRRAEAAKALREARKIWQRAHPEGHDMSKAIEASLSKAAE